VGGSVSVVFILLVIASQLLLLNLNTKFEEDPENQPFFWIYIPSVINTVLIIIFGQVYLKLCNYLVKQENHRYVGNVENSMINKIYMFQFINTYISNFVYIFYYQNFQMLQYNMVIVMVLK